MASKRSNDRGRKRSRGVNASPQQEPSVVDRRSFVKTTGGVLIATGFGAACSGDLNAPTVSGQVRGVILGLVGAGSGGIVTIAAVAIPDFVPLVIPLPANGDTGVVDDVPVGLYGVYYEPPTGHLLAPNEVNPRLVQVLQDQLTTVTYNVITAGATVRGVATGVAVGAANAGTVSVLRTDIANQSPVVRVIPTPANSLDAQIAVGTYSVTYTPPADHTVNGGVQNPQTLNATLGVISTVTFAVTAATGGGGLAPPNMLDDASFENNYNGMCSGGFTAPTSVTRDTTRAFNGTTAVRRVLPVTSGSDLGGQFFLPFYAGSPLNSYTPSPPVPAMTVDRLWARFYFYFDAAINGTLKFNIYESAGFGTQFGGFYCGGGNIEWAFIQEWNSAAFPLVSIASLVNGWHSLECDYWRNGDPSGFPSVGIWLDNVQLTAGIGFPPSSGRWLNGRLDAGQRGSTVQIGTFQMLGVLNGAPANTVAGNCWVDNVSVSSLGRIGP